jgi:phosphoglycolate phosphatase
MPVIDFFYALGFSKEEMARDAKKIQELFHSLYEPRIADIRTRTGTRQLLEFLADCGIECIILSNHTMEGITNQLKRLRIEKYFSRVITNDKHTTMERKNKAEKLVELVRSSAYKKEEILIIGDSMEEVEAAREAGIRCVSITGGYYSTRRLKEAKPDYLIHSLPEMIGIIQAL